MIAQVLKARASSCPTFSPLWRSLGEVANSATCVADTSHTSSSFPIEETTSFESLLNISADEEVVPADEEVLPDATEMLLDPATCPQIAFESAESEMDALSDACFPPSGAQAKSQEASTHMLDFDHRAIMVYGIPASDGPSPSTQVEYEIPKLRLYFSKVLAEDESVYVCKTYRVGPMGTNGDSRPRPLKVIRVANRVVSYYSSQN